MKNGQERARVEVVIPVRRMLLGLKWGSGDSSQGIVFKTHFGSGISDTGFGAGPGVEGKGEQR